MVTPEVVGLVGIVGLKNEREGRKSTARSPRMAISPFALTGPSPQEKEDHRDRLRAVAIVGQGCVWVVVGGSSREW